MKKQKFLTKTFKFPQHFEIFPEQFKNFSLKFPQQKAKSVPPHRVSIFPHFPRFLNASPIFIILLTQKSFDEDSYTRSQKSKTYPGSGRILNLRDAICQTSDTETRYFEEYEHRRYKASHSPLERRDSRRHYDQRRATTEALMQQPHSYGSGVNEGNTLRVSSMLSFYNTTME